MELANGSSRVRTSEVVAMQEQWMRRDSDEPMQQREDKKYRPHTQADDCAQQSAQVVAGSTGTACSALPVCPLSQQRCMPWSCFTWPMIGSIAWRRLSQRRCARVTAHTLQALSGCVGTE
jgi:hypothetical protein